MTDLSPVKKKVQAAENESTLDSSESQLILVQPETNSQIQIEPSNRNLTDHSQPPNLPIFGAVAAIAILLITLLWRQYQKYFGNSSLQPQMNSGYSSEAYGWDNETWNLDRREPVTQDLSTATKEKVFAGDSPQNRKVAQAPVKEDQETFSQIIVGQDLEAPRSVSQAPVNHNQEGIDQEYFNQVTTGHAKPEQVRISEVLVEENSLKKNTATAKNFGKTEQAKADYLAWNDRGVTFANNGELPKAVSSFDKSLRLKADYEQAWSNRGIALIGLGKYKKAVSSFDKAIKFKPDYAQAWNGRGLALANLGQYQEALLAHNHALEIESDDDEAWNNRGSALFNLDRLEEAIASYEKALEIHPEKDSAWCNRGFALAALGKLDEAISSYIEAIKIQPNHHAAQYKLSCAYAQQSSLEPALANLAHAINLEAKYLEMAKIDSDFDNIRDHSQFQILLNSSAN